MEKREKQFSTGWNWRRLFNGRLQSLIHPKTRDVEIHYATDRFKHFLAYDPKNQELPNLVTNTTTFIDFRVDRYSELVDDHP